VKTASETSTPARFDVEKAAAIVRPSMKL